MTGGSAIQGNRVWDLPQDLWTRGAAVHMPLGGGARCWMCRAPAAPLVAVFPDQKQAALFSDDWKTLFPEENIFLLQEIPLSPQSLSSKALLLQRGKTLETWKNSGGVLAAAGGALLAPISTGRGEMLLSAGKEYRREMLLDWFVHAGYARSDLVWAPGQFVFRGCILDVFDPANVFPLRIEFFDDGVESIRSFVPSTQKSIGILQEAEIHSIAHSRESSILDMFPRETAFLFFEPSRIETSADSYVFLWKDLAHRSGSPELPSWQEIFLALSSHPRLRITEALQYTEHAFPLEEAPLFKGNLEKFRWTCSTWKNGGWHVRMVTANPRILSFGDDFVTPIEGSLSRGFLDPLQKIAYISDLELAGISSGIFSRTGWTAPPREWNDRLSEGQLLVHEDYGICCFRGSEAVSVAGEAMDSLVLEFADKQRLFLPILQLHKITPLPDHLSADTHLDSLRGLKWKKSVEKTRKRVQEEIRALLELYAKREIVAGFAFPPRDDLFDAFEKAFPHVETKDQIQSISEVLADMEKPFPMDRLLVGDVGYGKTEVAIRAAFRAVQAGKQAAVLVPTTILAQQHFISFTARMTGFPVRIALLSRFVPRKEQKNILRDVAEGRADIVIGTARMLQGDVVFRDLGLIIVDEEHRFGVMSKEKLKQNRENADVLMLSATPIPRTLALSLRGLRSISLISEPPHNRIPVLTTAAPWNAGLVKSAVSRELERGGQVFYVTNRISRIEERAAFLRKLFPHAPLGVAHGRMRESELEETMLDFYNNRTRILLCTTIIESGLDIPGANTLIVDDSQELGLAQMYQLRGRVGRREETSYAYFLYPAGHPLGRETLERIDAITTLNETGAGYDLALQDLRIRGSGDILGISQHGAESGGADSFLYYSMLEQEIGRLRGGTPSSARIETNVPCLVPSFYIPQEAIRITLYRRLLRVRGMEDVIELEREVADRFGPLPESLKNLFCVSLLRARGGEYGIVSMECSPAETVLTGEGPLFAALRGKKSWYGLTGKMVGPGGCTGLGDLLTVLRHMKQVHRNG